MTHRRAVSFAVFSPSLAAPKTLPETAKVLLVVGPAAAGKTTYASAVRQLCPDTHAFDDLEPLLELVEVERSLREARRSRDHATLTRDVELCRSQVRFAGPYLDILSTALAAGSTRLPQYVEVLTDGFRIVEPSVWDWVLQLVTRQARCHSRSLIEFARGRDEAYLRATGATPQMVYERSIATVLRELPSTARCGILHVAAPFATRSHRNRCRREAGEHAVSVTAMSDVYKQEVFQFTRDPDDQRKGRLLVGEILIPVWSVDNSQALCIRDLLARARQEAAQALDHVF